MFFYKYTTTFIEYFDNTQQTPYFQENPQHSVITELLVFYDSELIGYNFVELFHPAQGCYEYREEISLSSKESRSDGRYYLMPINSSWVSSELCEIVLEKLGLPKIPVNPLVVKSFESSLKFRDNVDLLQKF